MAPHPRSALADAFRDDTVAAMQRLNSLVSECKKRSAAVDLASETMLAASAQSLAYSEQATRASYERIRASYELLRRVS